MLKHPELAVQAVPRPLVQVVTEEAKLQVGVYEAVPVVALNVSPLNSMGTQLPVVPVVTSVFPAESVPAMAAQQKPFSAQASDVVLFVQGAL